MELLLYILGFFSGIVATVWVIARAGYKAYQAQEGREQQVWHPNGEPCKDGHKWCEEHAKEGKFHCTNCPYVMQPGE